RAMTQTLDAWIDREFRIAAASMLESVSATGLVKARPGFGTTIRAAKGSVVASPVLASYDPDPDYFFHWLRDSAVVLEAIRLLHESGELAEPALGHFADSIDFNRRLASLDGRKLVLDPTWRAPVVPEFRKFLRDDAELANVHGEAVAAETRVNPDGTLDF